jgi:hypothetical protein
MMMLVSRVSLGFVLLLQLLLLQVSPSSAQLQSHPYSYPAGLKYCPHSDVVYVTGATYQPLGATGPSETASCFVGVASVTPHLQWLDQNVYSEAETCTAIALTSSSIRAVGATKQGHALLLGMKTSQNSATIIGPSLGATTDMGSATFPVAVVADETAVYVASMASSAAGSAEVTYPDLEHLYLDVTLRPHHGLRYHLQLNKINGDHSLTPNTWNSTFATEDGLSVYTTGMVSVGEDQLLVVGSTRGSGGIFGDNGPTADMDGFVVKLGKSNSDGGSSQHGGAVSTRVQSPNDQDDWITSVCVDPANPEFVYLVGATMGNNDRVAYQPITGSIHPLIIKLNVKTLFPAWWKHLQATDGANPTHARAYACAVSEDTLYVAGDVQDGATMVDPTTPQTSAGKNDLFVAKLSAGSTEGNLEWVRQVGTSENENLAHGGGIVLDGSDNAIILGKTTGGMYRQREARETATELVLFAVSQDGTLQAPLVVQPPTPADGDGVQATDATQPGELKDAALPLVQTSAFQMPSENKIGFIALIVGVSAIVLTMLFWCVQMHRKSVEKEAQKHQTLNVFKYLHNMNVDDIDIRRSPAGGFHVSYLNGMAQGNNSVEETWKETKESTEVSSSSYTAEDPKRSAEQSGLLSKRL